MSNATAWLGRALAAEGLVARAMRSPARRCLGRRFSRQAEVRVAIYGTLSRIAFAQIYPLLKNADALHRSHGIELRYMDIGDLLSAARPPLPADVVLVQPWFDVNRAALVRALSQSRALNPGARIVLMDPCAHNDLRLARFVAPFIDLYVKKSLFRDRTQYLRPTRGDTNLTDAFGRRLGCLQQMVDWQVPPAILPKLHLGPGFLTAPELWEQCLEPEPDWRGARPVDLHARLATSGSGWYAAMRREAEQKARELPGRIVTGTGVRRRAFMAELHQSKAVFSPFGYGELCWRDVEGVLSGAVVIKPDMGHLATCPDLFRPWQTYVPVRWDLSDLADNLAILQKDPELRVRIARAAWTTARTYLESGLQADLSAILMSPSMGHSAVQKVPVAV